MIQNTNAYFILFPILSVILFALLAEFHRGESKWTTCRLNFHSAYLFVRQMTFYVSNLTVFEAVTIVSLLARTLIYCILY